MVQLRNLLGFVSTAFVLAVLSLSSYPFLSQHLIGWTIGAIFVILGLRIIQVFAQMDRDSIISRITDTQAGKVGKEFYVRLATVGALPALTLLSAYFPPIGRFLAGLTQPALDALH
jgi:hypothetical protein